MEISVVVSARPGQPPDEDLRTAVVADRSGYPELWIGESWVWDCFALATAAGLSTSRMALTVGPIPVHLRDPAMIAVAAASTARLTGRRVGVALGTSSVRFVEGMHGRARHRPVRALAESARAVRSLLTGARTDLDGEVLATHHQLRLDPPGGPLTVAAFGDRAIAVAATHADRMLLDLVTPEAAAAFRAKLDDAAARAGHPAPRLAAWIPAALDPGPDAEAELRTNLSGYLEVPGYAEMFAAAGLGVELPPDAARRIGLVGDRETIAARLAAYDAAGLDEVALVVATAGDEGGERTLTAIAELRS